MLNLSFSLATQGLNSSAVREILKLTQGKDILSFAGGFPAEALFPQEEVREAYERVFKGDKTVLQYGLTEGFPKLREILCERMASKDVQVTPDDMLITTGSQQAIDLLCKILLDPNDVVLVENPTYLAALQVLSTFQTKVVSVDSDDDGMLIHDLEKKIAEHKPKLIYVTPTFSNPAGRLWSYERREGLVKLARKYGVLVLEDDPYGDIQFSSEPRVPLIYAIDQKFGEQRHVVYTSTFSKIVAPAVRTGWVIGPREVISMMTKAKQAADLHSSSLDQRALYELLSNFDINAHIKRISDEYYSRMKKLTSLMAEKQWPGIQWNEPGGGMFLWVTLPEHLSSLDWFKLAVEEGVAFVPGGPFYADVAPINKLRMNFTHTDPEKLSIGVERLDRSLNRLLETQVKTMS